MRTIIEALAEASARTQDPEHLAAVVRTKLGRMIVQGVLEDKDTLVVMTLDPALEQLLQNVLQQNSGNSGVVIEPGLAESLFSALRDSARNVEAQGYPAVLVVSPLVRPWLARSVRHRVNELMVLSYAEIPEEQQVKVVSTVTVEPKKKS
jgi:flagellar biosynthesis protein FlhA